MFDLRTLWRPGEALKLCRPVVRIIPCAVGSGLGLIRNLYRLNRRGRPYLQSQVKLEPNYVHSEVVRGRDGSVEDLGVSKNLLTNIGRDWWIQALGKSVAGNTVASNISTGVSATSITGTGSVWTASNLATPQLGCAGMRVQATPHVSTNPIVCGNIISNTTNVLTIDQWSKVDDTVGTTPTSGDSFSIFPGNIASLRYMAMSTDSGAPSASDKTLTSEVTTNGCGRVLAAYAHTYGTATGALSNTFTASGTVTGVHKLGLFTALSAAGADPMIYETALNNDATLGASDTIANTWTPTYSG